MQERKNKTYHGETIEPIVQKEKKNETYYNCKFNIIRRTTFANCEFSNCSFDRKDIAGVTFKYCKLISCSFIRARLTDVGFFRCDLSFSVFSNNTLNCRFHGSKLHGVSGIVGGIGRDPLYGSPLQVLKKQECPIVMFKLLVKRDYSLVSPYFRMLYEVGKEYSVDEYSTDEGICTGAGLHVSTLEYALRLKEIFKDSVIAKILIDSEDIVAVPFDSTGEVRVKRLKVVELLREVD